MNIKKVYIEKQNNKLGIEEQLVFDYCVENNIDYQFFYTKNLIRKQIALEKETLVVGGIPSVHQSFKQLGIDIPTINDYPEEIKKFLHRNICIKLAKDINHFPCFIKPALRLKKFTGFVINGREDLRGFVHVSGNELCYVSDIVNFVSEWRVFVLDQKILDIRPCPTNNDNDKFELDLNQIEQAVKLLGNQKIGYAVDFGLLDNHETALIEVNDGYSIGSYGLTKELYFSVLSNRWFQLMYPNS